MPRAFDRGMFPTVAASLRRGRRRRAAINFDAIANSGTGIAAGARSRARAHRLRLH